jgi:hypothetical protein
VTVFLREHLMLTGESRAEHAERRRKRRPFKPTWKRTGYQLATNRKKQRREAAQRLPKKSVDPFAGVPLKDRPMTDEQRSTLAALSRDQLLNFNFNTAATLTRGQADQLIPRLRRLVKRRRHAQLTKTKKPTKQRKS